MSPAGNETINAKPTAGPIAPTKMAIQGSMEAAMDSKIAPASGDMVRCAIRARTSLCVVSVKAIQTTMAIRLRPASSIVTTQSLAPVTPARLATLP
jgi:hypothetical protein